MRELMIRAWNLAKLFGFTISEALKMAWAEGKMRQGKWNGKVYGKKEYDNFNIYLNGVKTLISAKYADFILSLHENFSVFYKYEKMKNRTKPKAFSKKESIYEDEFMATLGIIG